MNRGLGLGNVMQSHNGPLVFLKVILFVYDCPGSPALCWAFSGGSEQVLLSSCSAQVSRWGGFSCCRAQAPGCVDSVDVARGLSCPAACGILLDQRSNPCPLHWQLDSYPLDHQESPMGLFKRNKKGQDS